MHAFFLGQSEWVCAELSKQKNTGQCRCIYGILPGVSSGRNQEKPLPWMDWQGRAVLQGVEEAAVKRREAQDIRV